MTKEERDKLEKQFMDEMVTPKMRKIEFDEFDKYAKELESRMWRGVFIASLVIAVGILIALIVYK